MHSTAIPFTPHKNISADTRGTPVCRRFVLFRVRAAYAAAAERSCQRTQSGPAMKIDE